MINNEVVSRIAQKIRTARLKRNLTVQELATRSRVSKGLLSKVENSRTVPSLPVFITLIQSLDLSLKEFFEDMTLLNGQDYVHIKKAELAPMEREARPGFHYLHILSQHVPACTLEASILTLDPGARGRPTTTDGYELKYMLQGECEYHIANDTILLQAGDALYFDASKPHVPINNSGETAMMLVIYFILTK